MVDVLASRGDERRGSLRKAPGNWQTSVDPEMSESGNRVELNTPSLLAEFIGQIERTQGTETSKYLQEKKKTLIP
jgi:hypothetical protein